MKIILTIALTVLVMLVIGTALIHGGGLANFAADEPHPPLINGVIAFVRERFIAARSKDLKVPDLDDPQLLADGAANYVPMCAGCHLGPGTQDTEIRRGLYPQPPNLAQPSGHAGGHDHSDMKQSAKRQFWIIKHGIKMTAMPAWGVTHDDEAIWGLVAFLQKLPEMSPDEFAALSEAATAGGHEQGMQKEDMQGMEGMTHEGMQKPAGSSDKPQPKSKDDQQTDGHQH